MAVRLPFTEHVLLSLPEVNGKDGTGGDDVKSVPAKHGYTVEDGRQNDNVSFSGRHDADQECTDTADKY